MPHPLTEAARIAKHDLGKYVAFQLRWLPPDAGPPELLEALRADVLQTRRGPDGSEDAIQIWARVRPGLAALGDDPDLAAVDAHMRALEAHLPGIAEGALAPADLRESADAARAVGRHLSALHKRLRGM